MLGLYGISSAPVSALPGTTLHVGFAELVGAVPSEGLQYEIHDDYDPYLRGTFGGKWIARNFFYHAIPARIREGLLGDALEDMRVRNYVVDRVEGPSSDGLLNFILKDKFALVEARKAVAPKASSGELVADILAAATTATLSPTGIGEVEYPTSGHVAINDEVMAFTRAGDVLTLTRAQFNTVAQDHKTEDLVQLCLVYTSRLGRDIINDLLVNFADIHYDFVPKAQWDLDAAALTELYTAVIAEPTPVNELIGEMCVTDGVTVWYDVADDEFKLRPLRRAAPFPTVTDNEWIVQRSVTTQRQDSKRASQVWVYYAKKDPITDVDDARGYRSRVISVDVEAELFYSTPAIRKVFSRFIPQFGRQLATDVAGRILAVHRDPPLEAEFNIHASRADELALAQPFLLKLAEVQDFSGKVFPSVMVPIRIERGENEIGIAAQEVSFFEEEVSDTRTIHIENDILDGNLRTIHDSLFEAPTGSTTVTFIILDGVVVGSSSTANAGLRTGVWPSGAMLTLEVLGRVQGKGGNGGAGGDDDVGGGDNGKPGIAGSLAFFAESPVFVTGTGEIWSGGGGGGGGGLGFDGNGDIHGGGGGGGGAGTNVGTAGPGGGIRVPGSGGGATPGSNGQPGTADTGGSGGGANGNAGDGGAGGNPGLSGSPGTAGGFSGGTPGAGAAPGAAINGVSLVTFDPEHTLDIRGAQIN